LSPQCADETPPIAGWRVAGASVAGTAHVRANAPCQDAHRWAVLPNGCLIIAVADGAGSAARSEEGARLAVEAADATLARVLVGDLPTDEQGWHAAIAGTLNAAFAAVAAHADATTAPLRDFATTLTVVAATGEQLAVGQIGDGIVVAEGDNGLFLAAAPQRGEYANEVALLTSPQAIADAAIASFRTSTRSVAVITDGLLRLAVRLPSHEPHAPFFYPLFAFVSETPDAAAAGAELVRFLSSARVAERTDDDTTLVLARHTHPSATVSVEAS
jgi:hypothetical protein